MRAITEVTNTQYKRTDVDPVQVMCWLLSSPGVSTDHHGSQKAKPPAVGGVAPALAGGSGGLSVDATDLIEAVVIAAVGLFHSTKV